jgi:hypothetical protein
MKRIISALMASSLLLAGQAFAADAIVFDGGDVRISPGNALVFQDGTPQTTATLKGDKGDQGIQGIQGIQGAKGDKGDPGVANGISKGVHGTVVGANVPSNSSGTVTGTGFYVNRTTTGSVGTYNITFNPAFSTPPDCVITPVGHNTNAIIQYGYVACELSTLVAPTFSAERARVECRHYQPYSVITSTANLIDTTFTFICVE